MNAVSGRWLGASALRRLMSWWCWPAQKKTTACLSMHLMFKLIETCDDGAFVIVPELCFQYAGLSLTPVLAKELTSLYLCPAVSLIVPNDRIGYRISDDFPATFTGFR